MARFRIPVYITCYNVLSWPRNLADQCARLGFDPILVDNASTYQPLLDWYVGCPYRVIRLNRNDGCYGFWARGEHARKAGYYVVTDCDLDLSGVPPDVADRLVDVFDRYPEVTKVGLSLEIGDLPDSFPLKESVVAHESGFWQEQVEPGVWRANVGATFAIYHPSRDYRRDFYRGLRLDRPYTARHLPWYLHGGNLTDEHCYYLNRVQTQTHWGARLTRVMQPVVCEDRFSFPTADCPRPEYWSATDATNPEQEVGDFVRGWVRLVKPDRCLAIAPGRGEVSRAIARALRDNGHGTLTVVTLDEHDRNTHELLCDRLPALIRQQDSRAFVPEHDYQFVWIGCGPADECLEAFDRLRDRCNGYVFFHGCVPGSQLAKRLGECERRQELHLLNLPTPRGLAIAETMLLRPHAKPSGTWRDIALEGGGGGREDMQDGWHEIAAGLFRCHDVLDVGAGLGMSRERLARTAGRVRLQDVGPGLPVDISLPVADLPDGEASAVTAFDVIEHVAEDEEFLLHLLRITRLYVFLTTPNWFVSRAGNLCHVREYTPAQLDSLCAATRARLRYWVGDPYGWSAREVSRDEFLASRDPHLAVLLDRTDLMDFRRLERTAKPTLDALYHRAITTPSDINEHCPRLRELAGQCDHVTEFGMRPTASTVALLAGRPRVLVSYDRRRYALADLLETLASPGVFRLLIGDSLSSEIEPTDLLFIDTTHTADHLSKELARHVEQVRRWIVLHDTATFGERGEDGGLGMLVALDRFVRDHPQWSVEERHSHQHGLTVLARARKAGTAGLPTAADGDGSGGSGLRPRLLNLHNRNPVDRDGRVG